MDLFNNDWPSPVKLEDTGNIQMDLVSELQDGTFEPQTRARSNTWPLPRPENFVDPPDESDSKQASNQQLATDSAQGSGQVAASKKNSSRRNAWGNLSYADLITHAIGSATDKRLTLSQIYEWMVQNVPYFKDKGDSNSSAGWKNSIRHNLSLHNRFMRVQNEGTGKSSWWMLNPDAKPGKSVRRRAASMETSKYEKRRGRAKKRVEALRAEGATGLNDATPSPSSSVSEGLDLFPESPLHSQGFPLSPDFRQRASSNASSCGRLSPIPALAEPEWSFASPSTSTTDFNQNSTTNVTTPAQAQVLDQLAGSLADDLTLQSKFLQGFSAATVINQPPPPYQPPQPWNATVAQTYGIQQNQCPIHRSLPCTCLHNTREGLSPSSGTDMSPAYPHSEPSPDPLGQYNTIVLGGQRLTPRPPSNSPPLTPTPQKMNQVGQVEAVELKWKNLGGSYMKYPKVLMGSNGSLRNVQNWSWPGQILQNKVLPKPTASNASETFAKVEIVDNNNSTTMDEEFVRPAPKSGESTEAVEIKSEEQAMLTLDGTDKIFLNYAETFKKYSPGTQAVIKMEMERIFGRAELREFDATTPPSSSPFPSSNSSLPDLFIVYPNTSQNVVNYIGPGSNGSVQQLYANNIFPELQYNNTLK